MKISILFLDGHDQAFPESHESVNVIRIPRKKLKRDRETETAYDLISNFVKASVSSGMT
ncbi:MAG: hypothetical protein MZV63_50420 [Marinilabiliales bacterium]|nr:hypothetical protein [Marinilabiliales bacterium]